MIKEVHTPIAPKLGLPKSLLLFIFIGFLNQECRKKNHGSRAI
ncbi:hypothetical protein MBGDF03_00985, partial [Thermoplasmatales archaeon SCGC AB-540-F20]